MLLDDLAPHDAAEIYAAMNHLAILDRYVAGGDPSRPVAQSPIWRGDPGIVVDYLLKTDV
jgi:hypothetical protein